MAAAAAAEEVLKLLDSYWFEYGVLFTAKPPPLSNPEQNPVLDYDEIREELEEEPINLSQIQTYRFRSLSDHCLSSDSVSPNSVLITPKLETILSGKEVQEFSEPERKQKEIETTTTLEKRVKERRRRRKKGGSRSLSELEFEELRGFMDLGFVFSEEDKNSSLVSILPGLQRLGRKVDNNGGDDDEKDEEEEEQQDQVKEIHGGSAAVVSRPYLSEAWDVLDQRKVDISTNKPLTLAWRIPALGNEMDMKDHLKIWARTVASTVR